MYCPYHQKNKHIPRKKLTQEEVEKEVIALQDMGHKRLASRPARTPSTAPLSMCWTASTPSTPSSTKTAPSAGVNVNIAATTVENYRKLKEAGIGTYVLFQETYHKESYEHLHPTGPKSNYCYHTEAMDRPWRAALTTWAWGVLFGLELYRYEFAGLLMHAEHLEAVHGVGPHTISVPRVKHADDIDPDEFDNGIGRRHLLKICACIRVAVPYTGMIMSTRENQSVGAGAASGHFPVSGGSRTSVGGYTEEERPHDTEQFDVSDNRTLDEVVAWLMELGYIPSFCTACYREGRTGDRFMSLCKSGQIQNCCHPQRPDDAEGVPNGLRRSGDQGHRGEADPGGAGEHPQGEGQGDLQGPPGEDRAGQSGTSGSKSVAGLDESRFGGGGYGRACADS